VRQLSAGGVIDIVGPEGVVVGDERVGAAVARAVSDAQEWIAADPRSARGPGDPGWPSTPGGPASG
jgi:hypothetical protein